MLSRTSHLLFPPFFFVLLLINFVFVACTPFPEKTASPQDLLALKDKAEELYQYSIELFGKGDAASLEEMEASLELAISMVGEEARFLDAKGCLEWKLGNKLIAEKHFIQALKLDPYFSEAWQHIAFVAVDRGEVSKGKKFLEQAIALKPDNYRAINNKALELAKSGKYRRAYDFLLQANLLSDGREDRIVNNLRLLAELR